MDWELFPFVHDNLYLYVRFEDGGLKFGFVGVSCDGAFGKVQVHVCPFHNFFKFFYLGMRVLDVICEQCWIVCDCVLSRRMCCGRC